MIIKTIRAQLLSTVAIVAFASTPRVMANVAKPIIEHLEATGIIASDELLTRSTDSGAMLDYWNMTDTIVEGAGAMRQATDLYLPKFDEEEPGDYNNRKNATKFTNIYRDIVEGLATKPFEEEVSLVENDKDTKPPAQIEDFIEDVDGSGNNLTVFASLTFFNGINSAIDWIFVDYPAANETRTIRTIADERKAGVRPFWSHVLGRNMLSVKSKMIAGIETFTYMKIFEPGEPDHVREFERDDNGVVTWKLWEKQKEFAPNGKTQFKIIDNGVISIGIIPLVPFITGRRDGRSFKFYPAMRDAADLQIELYQQESGLKYIKTLAAYPMLAANGIKPQMMEDGKTPKKLKTGPMRVLYGSINSNGDAGSWQFIEPSSQSMTFLANDVKATIEQLRELGRQPLTAQSGNLTVITTAVAAGKAKSAVGAWAINLKDTLENALVITAMWYSIRDYDPQVYVYNEFDNFTGDNKDLDALNTMRTNGDISQETYWIEMRRRRVLSPEFDAEAERDQLLSEVPDDPDLENVDDLGNVIPLPKQPAKPKGN